MIRVAGRHDRGRAAPRICGPTAGVLAAGGMIRDSGQKRGSVGGIELPHASGAAVVGGVDGLDFYRRFSAQAKPYLKPDGKIMLEFGDGQAEAIRKIFETEKWVVEAVKEDYSHRLRILIATSKSG